MVAPSGPSFIPKQPTTGKVKKRQVRKIYVLAYLSYVMFFGVLIASVGIFFYEISTRAQLEDEKENLVALKSTFSNSDFERVKSLEKQLQQADTLLNRHVSVVSIFEALESATLSSVLLSDFSLSRETGDVTMVLAANTDDFNSVLFQREMYEKNSILDGLIFSEPEMVVANINEGISVTSEKVVSFNLEKMFTLDEIVYQPQNFSESDLFTEDFSTTSPVVTEEYFDDESVLDTSLIDPESDLDDLSEDELDQSDLGEVIDDLN